jgi:hypothetical protein
MYRESLYFDKTEGTAFYHHFEGSIWMVGRREGLTVRNSGGRAKMGPRCGPEKPELGYSTLEILYVAETEENGTHGEDRGVGNPRFLPVLAFF